MDALQVFWTIVLGVISFGAGWLTATEKMRLEVYKARIEAYRSICRAGVKAMMVGAEFEAVRTAKSKQSAETPANERSKVELKLFEIGGTILDSALEMSDVVLVNSVFVSNDVGRCAARFLETCSEKGYDYGSQKEGLRFLVEAMGKDLGIKDLMKVNEVVLNPVALIARLGRTDKGSN